MGHHTIADRGGAGLHKIRLFGIIAGHIRDASLQAMIFAGAEYESLMSAIPDRSVIFARDRFPERMRSRAALIQPNCIGG
ncbi:protein of unknown function [Burkholderia multivorans]